MAMEQAMEGIDYRPSTFRTERENNRLSTIDGTTKYRTHQLQQQLGDATLGEEFVCKLYNRLGEDQIMHIAAYAVKNAHTSAGHLFVRICMKEMRKRGLLVEKEDA